MPEEKDESLQTAFSLYILAEGGDIVDGRILDFIQECSGSEMVVERQDSDSLCPLGQVF